jgi:hypothetical protein
MNTDRIQNMYTILMDYWGGDIKKEGKQNATKNGQR